MNKSNGIHQNRIKARLLRPKGKINRRDLFKLILPSLKADEVSFGRLRLDVSQCTGCGLCAQECSTGALSVSSGDEKDDYQLIFRRDLCDACGRCAEVCPEQCLHQESSLDQVKVNSCADLLFKSKIVRCRACNNVIASEAMINELQVKLKAAGSSLTHQLELCPTCKTKQSILGRTALMPDTRPD
jgi:ferredoxin